MEAERVAGPFPLETRTAAGPRWLWRLWRSERGLMWIDRHDDSGPGSGMRLPVPNDP